jgi:hypothetical protein
MLFLGIDAQDNTGGRRLCRYGIASQVRGPRCDVAVRARLDEWTSSQGLKAGLPAEPLFYLKPKMASLLG